MTRSMYVLLMTAVLCAPPVGSSAAQDSPVDAVRTDWLRSRTVDLDGFMHGADMPAEFVNALRSARVVAIGEATHGDGSAFEVRNVLTRALHESLGFDVLALEATGFHQSRRPSGADGPASAVVDSMESRLWRTSAQAREGLLYAARTLDSDRPLRIRGIDVQHRGADARDLFDEVESALRAEHLLDSDWPHVRSTLLHALNDPFYPVAESIIDLVTRRARGLIRQLRPSHGHAALLLESALANALVPWTESLHPRDLQMGKLLVHIAGADPPRDRIILWAASSHAVRNLPAIDTLAPTWSYDAAFSMGDVVADSLGEAYYVIAMTACDGTYGASAIGITEITIGPPDDRSLEALICSQPFETAAFLDLRGASAHPEGRWLHSPLLARPLGYVSKRASWPVVLDGLIFVRRMVPSEPYSP